LLFFHGLKVVDFCVFDIFIFDLITLLGLELAFFFDRFFVVFLMHGLVIVFDAFIEGLLLGLDGRHVSKGENTLTGLLGQRRP
jgi:hypothetical protein